MGPCGQSLRVLGVYGPASPSQCPKTVKLLHSHFINEISRARRNNIPILILGDFNDVPYGDLTFETRNQTYPEAFGLISALENRKFLDVFRTIHPQEHGHTFQKVRKKKPTTELLAAVVLESPPSRSHSACGTETEEREEDEGEFPAAKCPRRRLLPTLACLVTGRRRG